MPAASIQLNRFILADAAPASTGPSWFARAWIVIRDARMRQAEAQVARLIEARGGRFSDALEREIGQRAL